MSNPFELVLPTNNEESTSSKLRSNGRDGLNSTQGLWANQYDIGAKVTKDDVDLNVIVQDSKDLLKTLPGGNDIIGGFENTVNSAIDAFNSTLMNPSGLLLELGNSIKVRKVINRFFDGLIPFRNGKYSPNPISDSYLSKSQYVHNSTDGTTKSIAEYGNSVETVISSADDPQSRIIHHSGHGVKNQQFDTGSSVSIKEFPCYGTLQNFFKTTIGTHFYWGIKLEKSDNSYTDLPNPLFCDPSDKGLKADGKTVSEEGNKWFGGWLPATSFSFEEYEQETENLSSNAYVLPLLLGYKVGNSIKTTVIETSDLTARRWLEKFRKYMCPSPRVVKPYKKCTYKMSIFTYKPSGSELDKRVLLVIPNFEVSIDGENTMTAHEETISWTVVGRITD